MNENQMIDIQGSVPGRTMSPVANELARPRGFRSFKDWVRLRQPFLDDHGRAWVAVEDLDGKMTRNDSTGGEPKPLVRGYLVNELRFQRNLQLPPVCNAATLTREAWIELDRTVVKVAREPLTFYQAIRSKSSHGGFNAYGRMTLEYIAGSDPGRAVVDMDMRTDAENDTPLNLTFSTPIPIIHCDFGFSDRELEVSKNSLMPLDSYNAEWAGRRVGEMVEDLSLGNQVGPTYGTQSTGYGAHTGNSTLWGATNFTSRLTKTNFTAPSAGGWVPSTTITEVNTAIRQLKNNKHYGPFDLFVSPDWEPYLNGDYYHAITSGAVAPTRTLRERLLAIPDISSIQTVERLSATYAQGSATNVFTLLFVEPKWPTVRAINGRDVFTIQYQEKGGLEHFFKVGAIQFLQFGRDYVAQTGILHGTTA